MVAEMVVAEFLVVYVSDLITCFKYGDDRFSGLASAEGHILPFTIDFDGCPYNTLTLPCERVMKMKIAILVECNITE